MYRKQQGGFSLVMAIFIIVVLGGIAVFAARVSTMQQESNSLDEEGQMAFHAARSGIEWGTYQAIVNASCVGSTQFTIAVQTSLTTTANYTETVTCSQSATTEGVTAISVYNITATSNNMNSGRMYVERQLKATILKGS